MYKNLTTICAAAALALGLAACGGGGGGDTVQTGGGGGSGGGGQPVTLASLQGGMIVPPGTYEISGDAAALMAILNDLGALTVPDGGYAPGAEVTAGGLTLQCSPNSAANCNLTINDDGTVTTTGTILVATTGTALPDDRTDDQKVADSASAVSNLFATASSTQKAAETAGTAADDALKSAMENAGKLTTMSVQGDSTKAAQNAQAILNAKTDVATALTAAKAALADIVQAQTDAAAHADDPNYAALTDALAAAKKVAEAKIKEIEAIGEAKATDADSLASHVLKVTDPDGEDLEEEDLKTAADTGNAVALEVLGLIDDHTDTAALPGSASVTAVPAPTTMATQRDDHQGYTWEQLAAKLEKEPRWINIGKGTGTGEVQVLSARGVNVDGMAAPAPVATAAALPANDGVISSRTVFTHADGDTTAVTYKGLTGSVVCWGGPCAVKDGKLAAGEPGMSSVTGDAYQGHWYFTPGVIADLATATSHPSASRFVYYVANPQEEGEYMVETMNVRYGYWLSDTTSPADGTPEAFNRYAIGPAAAGNWATPGDDDNELADSATYTGPAVGTSVRQVRVDGKVTASHSGPFEATARLMATFGASPTLSGIIDGFSGGAHVNSGWVVNLEQTTGQGTVNAATTRGSGPGGASADGVWNATAYGGVTTGDADTPAARPTGIYGDFNANFVDGHAAGVFATRKQ